jgi:hypothetical protein
MMTNLSDVPLSVQYNKLVRNSELQPLVQTTETNGRRRTVRIRKFASVVNLATRMLEPVRDDL